MMLYLLFAAFLAAALAVVLWPLWKTGHARFAAGVAIAFFAGCFGLYALLGSPEIVPLMAQRDARLAELKTIITKDSGAVKADPKNLAAWVELGAAFMETNQFSAAANALKQAVIISGGDAKLILAYAKAQIFDADGKVTDEAKKGMEMVLLEQPQNPEARYWLTVRKLQDGKTQEAMREMKALYHSLPDDSPLKSMIDRQIGRTSN